MKALFSVVLAASGAVMVLGCGAAAPRKEASAADASAPVWTLSTKSDEARQHIEEGERATDRGFAVQGYEQFKRAVAADSAFAYGYLRVAQSAPSLDEYRTNLERAGAYEATANETEKLLIGIEQRFFERDAQGALALSTQLTQVEPKNPRSWWVLWGAQTNMGQTAESRASLQKGIDLAPNYGAVHLFMAQELTLTAPTDFAKADEHAQKGVELWPKEPFSWDALGDLRRAQNRLPEAAEAYAKQIELAPDQPDGYNQRGHVETFLGQYDKARADYDASIRHAEPSRKVGFAWYRAFVAAHEGNIHQSVLDLDQLAQAVDGMGVPDPMSAKRQTYQNEMILALPSGNVDDASKALEPYTALGRKQEEQVPTPEFKRGVESDLLFWQGRIAVEKGDYKTATQKAQDFMTMVAMENNPTKDRPAHFVLGLVALKQKKYDEAQKHLDGADPSNVLVTYYKALALEGAGRTAEAKELFTKVANHNFNAPQWAAIRQEAVAKAK